MVTVQEDGNFLGSGQTAECPEGLNAGGRGLQGCPGSGWEAKAFLPGGFWQSWLRLSLSLSSLPLAPLWLANGYGALSGVPATALSALFILHYPWEGGVLLLCPFLRWEDQDTKRSNGSLQGPQPGFRPQQPRSGG